MNIKKISAFTSAMTLAVFLALGSTAASAQTTGTGATGTTTGTTGTAGTIGAPNTGAGGERAMNVALLAASGAVALGGAAYLARQRKAA